MSKIDKLYSKMKNNPKEVSFHEITTLCEHYGCTVRNESGGSHYSIRHSKINRTLIVANHDPIKKPYVLDVLQFIDELKEDEK
ncbi:hypothetical protein [Lactobacillus sp. B4005]|uniref:hypothetical protein n=1 Tax=Lactobacillus sp. B4005 TaxID=2818031 RepID=UPI002269A77F|nr:hypothetical protein [Lactobacillus sp. B4005]MCX8723068.1 hypothetical protein [Lactobacillus sp. B4005]